MENLSALKIDYSKVKSQTVELALQACLELQINGLTHYSAELSINALCEAARMDWGEIEEKVLED